MLRAARENAERAGVASDIHFQATPMESVTSKRRFGCLITNPPYGQRVGRDYDLEFLYQTIPNVLRKLPTWSHYFLTAFPEFEHTMGRQADRRRKLYNGRIECTYFQYHGPKPVVGKGPEQKSQPAETTAKPASKLPANGANIWPTDNATTETAVEESERVDEAPSAENTSQGMFKASNGKW